MFDLPALGAHIQRLRTGRGLSLRGLADTCGVSVGMLSAVERGEKAATIVVLDRIAGGLGVPLDRLVTRDPDDSVIVRRAADQDTVDEPGGWRRTVLTPVVPGVNFEWVRTELPPGCDAGEFPAYAPGSHIFIAVDEGTLRMTLGERVVDLAAGDSLYFSPDTVHGYANPGTTPARYAVAALIMRPRTAGLARPRRRTP
ncbi:helix-turn-helix domain-containing protein [Nocardiopsis sediminis]|uniref:Helix-turn-helix domain-containing protein n=2 Tax=Nocardiopsis sediminis TaxID=1778267 RepID=A0ABV8FQQ0_9ACTN